jgi:hypothetical protein
MMGRLWVLVESLIVSDHWDGVGENGNMILKLVVYKQGDHLDLGELLLTRQ